MPGAGPPPAPRAAIQRPPGPDREGDTVQLDLLRHAKSSWADPDHDDHERPLNARGETAAGAIGRYLAARGSLPDVVLCSSARRARETWERVARELPAEHPVELAVEDSLYLASPGALLERLRAIPAQVTSAMLVGHNPGLAQLAGALSREDPFNRGLDAMRAKYPTAGLATLRFEDPWGELAVGRGDLVRFLTPKDLA